MGCLGLSYTEVPGQGNLGQCLEIRNWLKTNRKKDRAG